VIATPPPAPAPVPLERLLSLSWALFKRNWIVALPPVIAFVIIGAAFAALVGGFVVAVLAHGVGHGASRLVGPSLAGLLGFGVLSVVVGVWAVWRRVYPVACGALGAYCNEIVRAANGGSMPVEGHGVMAEIGSRTGTYVLADAHTNFAWLDDRFHLPAPFPGIASVGDILIAIAMAWLVASLMLRRAAAETAEVAADDAGAPAAEAEAAA